MPDTPDSSSGPNVTDGKPQATASRRGTIAKWALAAVAVGGAVGGGMLWRQNQLENERQARQQTAGQSWANAYACIIGEPLDDDETLTQRLRAIQLELLEAKRKGAVPAGDWPSSCAVHLTTLYAAIDFDGLTGDLKQSLVEKFGCDQGCEVSDPVRQMQGMPAMAHDAELVELAANVAAVARVKAKLLGQAAFEPLAAADARVQDRIVTDDATTHLLLADKRHGLQLCTVRATDGWNCRALRLELTPSTVRLVRVDERVLLRGRLNSQGKKVVVDVDGHLVKRKRGVHTGFGLQRSDDDIKVSLVVAGEVKHQQRFAAPTDAVVTRVGNSLLWVAGAAEAAPVLHTRALREEKNVVGPAQALGSLGGAAELTRVCRNGDNRVAFFGTPQQPRAMAFYDGDAWSAPVQIPEAAAGADSQAMVAPSASASASARPSNSSANHASAAPPPSASPSGARTAAVRAQLGDFGMLGVLGRPRAADPGDSSAGGWGTPPPAKPSRAWATLKPKTRRSTPRLPKLAFSCGHSDAVMTWRVPGELQTIVQLRCDRNGCSHKRAVLAGLSVKAWWTAATVGDSVLLVWRSEQGALRMRLAPIEQLASAPDRLVMDSAEHGGPDTRNLEAVIGRDALLFLFGGNGLRGLRFDAEGSAAPLPVQH